MLGWSIKRQCLALGLKAGEDGLGVHAELDQLECDQALDGVALLGHVDGAHTALADRLEELVAAVDAGPDRRAIGHGQGGRRGHREPTAHRVEDVVGLGVGPQEVLDAAAEPQVAGAGLGEEGGALGLGRLVQRRR